MEPTTGINYISDSPFISTGVRNSISPQYKVNSPKQLINLRSFPDGIRNCYTINTERGTQYLIRATFFYGNYDYKYKMPEFEIHLGTNFLVTVKIHSIEYYSMEEIIHLPLQNYIRVCLVNTGYGTPFISALELRPLKNTTYVALPRSLAVMNRMDTGPITNVSYR